MGCDIHFYVERQEADRWITCDTWEQEDDALRVPHKKKAFYSNRNYDLFAILADVRNGEGFNPIAPPRGVPEDCCEEYRAAVERWSGDGHSHSFFTVAELMAYDWTQCTRWGIPYYQAGRTLLSEVLPRLWRLGSPDKVRCTFFFDN